MLNLLNRLWLAVFPPPALGAILQPPGLDEQAAHARFARSHLERHLAQHIFCQAVGSLSMEDGDSGKRNDVTLLAIAALSRRAATLYANGEDFG